MKAFIVLIIFDGFKMQRDENKSLDTTVKNWALGDEW